MNYIAMIQNRRSVRAFRSKEVSDATLAELFPILAKELGKELKDQPERPTDGKTRGGEGKRRAEKDHSGRSTDGKTVR